MLRTKKIVLGRDPGGPSHNPGPGYIGIAEQRLELILLLAFSTVIRCLSPYQLCVFMDVLYVMFSFLVPRWKIRPKLRQFH